MFLRCLLCRPAPTLKSQRSFLVKVREHMVKAASVNPRQEEILGRLIQSEDKKLFSSASKFINNEPGSTEVHSEVRKKVMSHLEAAWEESFKDMTTMHARWLAHKGKEMHGTENNLTYGEVRFDSLANILCEDLKTHGIPLTGTFYDLGSGTGRGVIAAALVGNFERLCGIEVIKELYEASLKVQDEYEMRVAPRHGISNSEIKFVKGNLLRADWSDASVIFINSTCFAKPFMEQIAGKAMLLRPGACVVTLTQPIISPYFDLLESKKYEMSWGTATAHIHRRTEKECRQLENKARYWSKKVTGRKDFGALFDGYTSA